MQIRADVAPGPVLALGSPTRVSPLPAILLGTGDMSVSPTQALPAPPWWSFASECPWDLKQHSQLDLNPTAQQPLNTT